jgi:hypothetical protein
MPQPWTIEIENVVLKSAEHPFPFPERSSIDEILPKVTKAIRLAEQMAVSARKIIQKMAIVPEKQQRNRGNEEVMDALIKYFNLHPTYSLYVRTVQRMVNVFQAIEKGLTCGYTLYVYSAPTAESNMASAAGFCTVDRNANWALGQLFLREDHIDWSVFQNLAKGKRLSAPSQEIHLKYEFLVREDLKEDMIAHTIVHEASHKWAYTTDVCYKQNTVAKLGSLEDAVKMGFQKEVERIADYDPSIWGEEGKKKPLHPMTKPEKQVPTFATDLQLKTINMQLETLSKAEMWVKNADSYAWAARRLWKKEPIIASAASGGRFVSIDAI